MPLALGAGGAPPFSYSPHMASGYRAYEINGTHYDSLADTSHADHLLVSALLFKVGVPGPDEAPETFAIRYDPAVIFPNIRDVRLTESDLVNVFDEGTRRRILVDGNPMPPKVCDRLLGVLLLKTYGERIESSARFLLGSTIQSSSSNFFERFNRAVDEGDVDLGSISVQEFEGTHLLLDRSAGEPSIDMQSKPYSPPVMQDRTEDQGQDREEGRTKDGGPGETQDEAAKPATHPEKAPSSQQTNAQSGDAGDEASRPDESAFSDPSTIATGTEVDPEADHVPDNVARDIKRLRDSVDNDHDFGASYDFTPSTIDSPTDTADVPVAGETDADALGTTNPPSEDLDDVSEKVASEVATSSLDYRFGPLRSIEEDLGGSSGYRFGPSRSLEDDLGAGLSRTWAETMENASRIEDTSASYSTRPYNFGPTSYDVGETPYNFDTSDLYDFTPPDYGEAGTSENGSEASANEPTRSSSISVSAGGRLSSIAQDASAMGSRVLGIAADQAGASAQKTNEGTGFGLVSQLALIICILTGLVYLLLSM